MMPDMRDPGHLPNLRADGEPPRPDWLPRQRRGTTPQMVGRFPDYDVLESVEHWDHATRDVVLARLSVADKFSFFSVEQQPTLRAFCEVVLAQDIEPRIPVAELVDAKLAAGRLDGYQYEGMPDDRETWRLALDGLDAAAEHWHGHVSLADCEAKDREGIVKAFAEGWLHGDVWEKLDMSHAWEVCTRMMLEAFYSHPWAWNEIGFGGPAYPRGFMRLGPLSTLEPHERAGATAEDPVRVAGEFPG
jgi:hypothetical protein